MRLLAIVCFIFSFSLSGLGQVADSISFVKYGGQNFENALKDLRQREEVPLSYDPLAVSRITVPTLTTEISSIDDFLRVVLADSPLTFEVISDTYVIYPVSQSQSVEAFPLSGVVRDKDTGESLPFATIRIAYTNQSTTANTEGRFTLFEVPSDTSTVTVSYLGYKPISMKVGRQAYLTKSIDIKMARKLKDLPFVQISARGNNLLEVDQNISQFTLNPSEIFTLPNLGEPDVFSALRRLPGISGGQDAESGLRIRGGQTDQNLVMFDGISVYHVDHLFGFLSAFNSNVIKNIRVNKGGFDARYGGRTSGVVDITGIDGNKVEPSLQAEATLLSANVLVQLPVVKDKASLVFGYRRAFTNLLQTPTYQNIFNNIFNSSLPNTPDNNTNVFDGNNGKVRSGFTGELKRIAHKEYDPFKIFGIAHDLFGRILNYIFLMMINF